MAYLSMLSVLTKSPCFAPMSSMSPHSCSLSVGKSRLDLGRTREAVSTRVIPPKEGILVLHVLLTCQAQNRTTIPSKSGDGSHILRLTAAMQPVKMILRVGKGSVNKEGESLEVSCMATSG